MYLAFDERFGRRGLSPRGYWSFEIGHILPSITRENVGTLKWTDLLGAAKLFDAKYRGGDE